MTTLTESGKLFSQSATSGNITDSWVADRQSAITIADMSKHSAGFVDTDSPTIPGESEYWHGSSLFTDKKRLKISIEVSKSIAVFVVKDTFAPEHAGKKFLAEALDELAELDDDAKEDNLTPPSPVAKEQAKKFLEELTLIFPREYALSLWEDGDVIIYASGSGWRVSVFCRANGAAALYVTSPTGLDDESHQYKSAHNLFGKIEIVIKALKKIPA